MRRDGGGGGGGGGRGGGEGWGAGGEGLQSDKLDNLWIDFTAIVLDATDNVSAEENEMPDYPANMSDFCERRQTQFPITDSTCC